MKHIETLNKFKKKVVKWTISDFFWKLREKKNIFKLSMNLLSLRIYIEGNILSNIEIWNFLLCL